MSQDDRASTKPSLSSLRSVGRKAVHVSSESLVKTGALAPGQSLPLVVEPEGGGLDLQGWLAGNADWVRAKLTELGGLLFRGFATGGAEELEACVRTLSSDILEYTYRSTPRREVSGRIYSSTEYPPEEPIPMHNEMSYTRSWPMKIWFMSVKTAASGGETPIADSRKVLARLDPELRQRFHAKGVSYVRNYRGGIDLTWQEVFQTENRERVEDYCRRSGIELEWTGSDSCRTRQTAQALARHPVTGDVVWFNQAHLFHVTALPPDIQQFLIGEYGEEGLPRNSFYGDGTPIEVEALEQIRDAYRREEVVFPWRQGDVLLLDNMLTAHGRRPFSGERKVVVGMAEDQRDPGI